MQLSRRAALRSLGAAVTVAAAASCAGRAGRPRPGAPVALMPVEAWQEMFPRAESSREYFVSLSRSPEPQGYYELAYGVDAYTTMFEATNDVAYLETTADFIEGMISQARPSASFPTSRYRDGFLTWVSEKDEVQGEEVPLYDSYCWRYVVRYLRTIRDDPRLYGSSAWRRRYEATLAFSEQNIFDKWYARGPEEHIYRSRTHMASHWAYIAMNLGALTASPERRAACRQVFEAINRRLPNYPSSLRGQLRTTDEDGYDWSAVWGEETPSQDVSHGNNVIAYVVEAHERGQEWTREDIDRFRVTLDSTVWREDGTVSELVDGSGDGDGWLSDGFVKLGRFDALLQKRLESHPVRDQQFMAAMALNSRRLATRAG